MHFPSYRLKQHIETICIVLFIQLTALYRISHLHFIIYNFNKGNKIALNMDSLQGMVLQLEWIQY